MMIDSEKLMGRMESKGTLLSEKSISNVGVIRRRLVDIDGMLKDKLVLAKVREGIRRQEEERLRRVEREDDIEERDDDDRDIDMDDGKRKRKKPKPGGPSNILGPAGAILTGAGIALIANNLGTFRVTAQVLKGIGQKAHMDVVALNTSLVLWAAGVEDDIERGFEKALFSMSKAKPWDKFLRLKAYLES